MMDGFLNVYKEKKMTSHDVVNRLRRLLQIKKIGHLGTLDPNATGVLPIAIGRATNFISYVQRHDKKYLAEMTFGYETDSGDTDGAIIREEKIFSLPTKDDLKKILQENFLGEIEQEPPIFSAIKVHGVPAYKLARHSEKKISLPVRTVQIFSVEIVNYEPEKNRLCVEIFCSQGTYIRSFCRDLGKKIGVPCTMTSLLRKASGDFLLQESYTLDEIAQKNFQLISIETVLNSLAPFFLPAHRVKPFLNGLPTDVKNISPEKKFVRVYDEKIFLGIGRFENQQLFPEKIYKID